MTSVVIVGKNRTLMTIECIKSIKQHFKCKDYMIIVGSDRSDHGHVQALNYYMNTLDVKHKVLECCSLGGMMNKCCDEAFGTSEHVLCIENDMILHRDLFIDQFIDLLEHTNAGNVQFRYFSPSTHKCNVKLFEFNGKNYMFTIPGNDINITCPVSFGQNFFKKEFYEAIGKFLENEFDTDKVERSFINNYCRQLSSMKPLVNALCMDDAHSMMNDERGYFYHIGINCQHDENVKWNKKIIPCQYHYLSDDSLDSFFRSKFKETQHGHSTTNIIS